MNPPPAPSSSPPLAQEAVLSPLWNGWRPWNQISEFLVHRKDGATVVMVCFLAAHFCWLATNGISSSVGPDSHDYFLSGRLLAEQHSSGIEVKSPIVFVGQQWFPAHDARYHSVHDVGFPVLLAAWRILLGGGATEWVVNPLLTSLTLLGFFLWATRHAGRWFALAGMVVLASLPALNQSAGFGDSHPSTTFCMAWALLLTEGDGQGRQWLRALLAGVLLGMIPVIRSADVLVSCALGGVTVLRALLDQKAGARQRWGFTILLMTGAAVPLALLMLHNWSCYGAPWKTAYSAFGGEGIFAVKYVARNAKDLARLFGTGSHAYLMWLGLTGLLLTLIRRKNLWLVAIIVAGALGNAAVYLPFYWPVEEISDRFFLPIFVLMAGALVLGLQSLSSMGRVTSAIATVMVMAASIFMGATTSQKRMDELTLRDHVLRDARALIAQKVPRGSVVIADAAIAQDLDTQGGWQMVLIGQLVPPQLRGMRPKTDTQQARPISRRFMGADDWTRSMVTMPLEKFDEKALSELKSLAGGKNFYVLALPHEWEGLSRRWNGNWTLLGSVSLPLEEPGPSTSGSAAAGPQPMARGKLYDLHLDGKSVDLMQAHLW